MGALRLLVVVALVAVACSSTPPATTSPTPTSTADIRRTRLDISYTAMAEIDAHKASSKKILEAAVAGINAEIKRTGGKGEIAPIAFQDVTAPVNADFKKFADSASQVKALNPQISADRFADVAIIGMISVSPDCHTVYFNKNGMLFRSLSRTATGSQARIPTVGTSLGGPDVSGMTGRILPDGIVYITWNKFLVDANYKFYDSMRAMMEKGLAAGGKAWLFDLRGNGGGYDADYISSFFLNGEPMLKAIYRDSSPATIYARKEWRLPDQYQKPIAIVLNDQGGSGPEFFAAQLRENKRATVVGSTTTGCFGATNVTNFQDGGLIEVVSTLYEGANTGANYNGVGLTPDVPADDATAVDKAIAILKAKI
jgi:C-terminal processing protease CtpA/Prc